ncbi:hypothetical protein ACS0TY_008285 [Phlomoides rotata]
MPISNFFLSKPHRNRAFLPSLYQHPLSPNAAVSRPLLPTRRSHRRAPPLCSRSRAPPLCPIARAPVSPCFDSATRRPSDRRRSISLSLTTTPSPLFRPQAVVPPGPGGDDVSHSDGDESRDFFLVAAQPLLCTTSGAGLSSTRLTIDLLSEYGYRVELEFIEFFCETSSIDSNSVYKHLNSLKIWIIPKNQYFSLPKALNTPE